MPYDIPHWINGKGVVRSGQRLPVYAPTKGEIAGQLTVADAAIVNEAVNAAQAAFINWSVTTPAQRAKILFRFKTLLDDHLNDLAAIITREHGKTIPEAAGSVQRGIDVVNFVCGIPDHLKGSYVARAATGVDSYSLHQPIGVCIGITPFNFPGMIPLWMFPMAIACGNTFILKPSEKDPSCSIRLLELAKEAGVPDGVVNVVQGDKSTVDLLLKHPGIQAVNFVGSSTVAEYVQQTATLHHKRVQAFGGAKNHCVVMPDADMQQAAEAIVSAAYGSAGERCMAISVVVTVGDSTADQLITLMLPLINALKMGPGELPETDLGPLITQLHWERVQEYVKLGQQEGAKLVIDHRLKKPSHAEAGFFMGACLFDQVKPTMRIYREEIFGPVLSIVRVQDFETALKLVNEHEYGNGAAIFTRDGYTARTYAERAQAGMIGINVPIPVPVAQHSFGGWKRSIFSDTQMYGPNAIHFYTKLKTVTERWYPEKNS